jgi:FAD/FMN-containing dehydrogenase
MYTIIQDLVAGNIDTAKYIILPCFLHAFNEIFTEAIKLGGTISGEHGIGLAKRQFLEKLTPPPAIEMMRRIKESIDPNSVLNPGKIFSLKPRCEGPMPKNIAQLKQYIDAGAFT